MTEITAIPSKQHILLSSSANALEILGKNIKLARKRRNWSEHKLAKKAGIARSTLQFIEQGKRSVSIGSYFQALLVMGIANDLASVGMNDELGRQIVDEKLLQKKSKP